MRAPVALLSLAAILLAPAAVAADDPVVVDVGVLAINFGNYDANKGTYVMDVYLWMRWTPPEDDPAFEPSSFEFMNGRASSKERIFDDVDADTGQREAWWRIQANLLTDPRFENYPYDTQVLALVVEDARRNASELRYRALVDESGIDEDFRVAGWRIRGWTMETVDKEYVFGETYDRLRFAVEVEREPTGATLRSFLPVAAFVVVSGLAFFFHPSKIAQRLTLGTSMLISAVLFHISQTLNLPASGNLILFDKVMLAVYSNIAVGLMATTLISIDEDFWKDRDHTRAINVWGAVAAVVLPLVVFASLTLL